MNEEEIKYIEETDIYSLGHEDKFDEIIKFDKAIKNLIKENQELKEETTQLKGVLKHFEQLIKENEKLKKNEIIAENRIAELSIRHGNDRDKIRYLQKESQELKEKIKEYEIGKKQE